jgi:osmotically-inducible protein OsmY
MMTAQPVAEPARLVVEDQASTWNAKIRQRLGGRIRELRVLVREDGVVLQGRVSTYHAKQLAQHAAMEVSGRAIVSNEIVVG